jgi:hypothetical protein
MTKTMSYEMSLITRVLLIADISYARDGRCMYITVESNGSERISWTAITFGEWRNQGRLILRISKNAS